MEAHFFGNRRWFFGLLALTLVLDVPKTVAKQTAGLRDVPVQYLLFQPFVLAFAVVGWTTESRRVHGFIAVGFLATQITYLTLTAAHRITAS